MVMEVYNVFPTAMTVEAFVTLHYDTRGIRDMEILSQGQVYRRREWGVAFFWFRLALSLVLATCERLY